MTRQAFLEELEKKRALEGELRALRDHLIHRELEEALLAAAVEAFGKKAKKWNLAKISKKLPVEEVVRIRTPFVERFDRMTGEVKARIEASEARLVELAKDAEILPGPPKAFYEVRPSDYMSVGLGCAKYAEARAEQKADVARMNGVGVKVEHVGKTTWNHGPHYGITSDERFTVFVEVAGEGDVEILRRRPGPTQREWVRMCWKRGVNPRVYDPFLPVGYEEEAGLDFFGGEKR